MPPDPPSGKVGKWFSVKAEQNRLYIIIIIIGETEFNICKTRNA